VIDYVGKVITELGDDAAVFALTDRVRGHAPGPNDARGPGEYVSFIVVNDLGGIPLQRTPVQFGVVHVRCYGVTPQGAKALYVAASNALHAIGPRVHSTIGIHRSWDDSGGDEGSDPRTHQPYVEGTFQFIVSAAAVA
jgi:hypothetical protein